MKDDIKYYNCLNKEINSNEVLSVFLSDRHFGVGSDGIVLICNSEKTDARMKMYNADGSEGKMCGNAIRCVAKFLYDNGIVNDKKMKIETASGVRALELKIGDSKVSSVKVNMGVAVFDPVKIPVNLSGESVINRIVNIANENYKINCVSVGNPHCVIFYDEIDNLNISDIGKKFENSEIFPEGINIEFVKIVNENSIKMRVWERGSAETFGCGTGACAASVCSVLNGYFEKNKDIKIFLRGGEMSVNYTDKNIYMTGECEKVFDGTIEV
jgi:carbamoyl-phosphate synthase large subunit